MWAEAVMPIKRGSIGNRENIEPGSIFETTEAQFNELSKLKAVKPADKPPADEPEEAPVVVADEPVVNPVRPAPSQPVVKA